MAGRRLRLASLATLVLVGACAARTPPPQASAFLRPHATAGDGAGQEPAGAPKPERGRIREYLSKNRGSLLGVGVGFRIAGTPGLDVGNAVDLAPLVRLGTGRGWGPAIGLGWSTRELFGPASGTTPLADLRVRPLMVGVAYTRPVGRTQLSASLVGGYAFTRLKNVTAVTSGPRATGVDDAFVWRPSASLWIATTDRLALQVSAGYLVTRPRVTFATGDRVDAARVRADALMISVGAAWWVF